mmetsp:Transcript_38000/g.81715  ORF Transcript_38000/g.81715 Transcript_38000/m.81715 type:complete len:212 (+) Transcript_38000:262-897(+)
MHPIAKYLAVSWTRSDAYLSPASACLKTSSQSRAFNSLRDESADRASLALIASALADAYPSRMPFTPATPKGRPSGTKIEWPISPAWPLLPRRSRPSHMIAPPTPVPTVTKTICFMPAAAPVQASASKAAFVSFSKETLEGSQPSSSARSRTSGTSLQPRRFAAARTTPATVSISPGVQTPKASISSSRWVFSTPLQSNASKRARMRLTMH